MRLVEIALLNTDDDVQLARALVDHADIDVGTGDRIEHASRRTLGLDHTASHDGQQCHAVLNDDAVGADALVERGDELFLTPLQIFGGDHHAHGVHARGQMLKGDLVVLQNVQNASAKADLGVHQILLDGDDRKALLARNTRDDALGIILLGSRHDHGSGSVRIVGVADIDRNACVAHGENSLLMQNRCTHVGKLAQLAIGDGLDGLGVLDHARVCHHKARDVGPVLVERRVCRLRNDRAGHVRATAAEGLDRAVGHDTVKAGDHGVAVLLELLTHLLLGLFLVVHAVLAEEDHRLGVDKVKAEVLGQDQRIEVLAAACGKITSRVVRDGVADVIQLARNVKLQTELADDAVVALGDLCIIGGNILVIADHIVAVVEHIRNLNVVTVALSGRRRHDEATVGIALDDLGDLAELLGICQRGASEFNNLDSHEYCNFLSCRRMACSLVR